MPAAPLPVATIYDTVNSILLAAKARTNDVIKTLQPASGRMLENTQAFTQQVFNNGSRRFQNELMNLGSTRFNFEFFIYGFYQAANPSDPSTQSWINWFASSDGVNQYTTPVLPPNLLIPLWIKERIPGYNSMFSGPMENMMDGLPGYTKGPFNRYWTWRNDTIYLPGTTSPIDLQIKALMYINDIIDNSPTNGLPWFQQPYPIARCQDALSLYVAAEAMIDNIQAASILEQKGKDATKLIFNRDVKAKQRVNVRRKSRSGRLEGESYGGWGC